MFAHVPEAPVQIDPLIAEARRRTRRRRLFELAALVAVAAVASSLARGALAHPAAGARAFSSGKQCARSADYGDQCVVVRGSGRRVTAIQTTFTGTQMLLDNKWRVDVERYNCNPVGHVKAECPAVTVWRGRTRPPVLTPGNRVPDQVRFAQARSGGYWPTFSLPQAFPANVWLCTEVAAYVPLRGGHWVYNAAGLTHGLRACAAVHA
jgi:hypothetical protein